MEVIGGRGGGRKLGSVRAGEHFSAECRLELAQALQSTLAALLGPSGVEDGAGWRWGLGRVKTGCLSEWVIMAVGMGL